MSDGNRPPKVMSWWDKAAIGAMGGVGGALSYDALQQMAVAMHIRPELTYLFPVAIDGFIAYGTRALVVLKEAPLRARAYTWSVFGSATATSVWANWTHAVRLNDMAPPSEGLHLPDWSVGVLSTIAPLVLGGATHLYIVMSRHASGNDSDTDTAPGTQQQNKARRFRSAEADQDAQAKPAVRTRWWNRNRAEAASLDSTTLPAADQQHELPAVPAPSPVSLTKAPDVTTALPPGPPATTGTQPQTVPAVEPVPVAATAASGTSPGPGTAPVPQPAVPGPRNPDPGTAPVPSPGTAPVPGSPGTVPAEPTPKPGTAPSPLTPPSGPASSTPGTTPVPAAAAGATTPAPLVPAAPAAAVPAAPVPPTAPDPARGTGPVPASGAPPRTGGEAAGAGGRASAATTTAPHRTPAPTTVPPSPSPSPVPAVPNPAPSVAAARPRDAGTIPPPTPALRAVPASGTESTGTGPTPRAVPDPVPAPSSSRPPVPGRGPDGESRRRELSEDELEALLPIGRTVAAAAEGRLTRETLRAGLKAQNVPINNLALGQLLRELKDIEGKPPPSRR
ncbi:DUF2637 domain-containing protein [Peterkaempfera bronchialis]|uniref:DUF2637 domain-containing protein n=1 Tax=Peterkaempfera bronchialis TaxID=2126346 RepID=UPI003C2E6731